MTTRVHIEVIQNPESGLDPSVIKKEVSEYLKNTHKFLRHKTLIGPNQFTGYPLIACNVQKILVEFEGDDLESLIPIDPNEVNIYVYKLDSSGFQVEELDGNDGIHAANNYMLPSLDFHGLWDSLIYDDNIKDKLIRYIQTGMILSDRGFDPNQTSWNKVILLHGPPGTGKTSLCKALAQKMAIRMSNHYSYGVLVEINSHSLFSKWFSESGKLVQKMFEQIQEMVEDPKAFICVLIDEVESLSAARKASANESSETIRVVNALLTQIDAIKRFPNVLIMTTSNVTGTIDLAFVDRADIKHYIGNPSAHAIYSMLLGSIQDYERIGLLFGSNISDSGDNNNKTNLIHLCQKCHGFSGRAIRRLPFLALTHIPKFPIAINDFFIGLSKAIDELRDEMKTLQSNPMANGH